MPTVRFPELLGLVVAEIGFQFFSLISKFLYALLNSDNPNPILWEELDNITFMLLMKSEMRPLPLGIPVIRFSFLSLFVSFFFFKYIYI